MSTATIDRVAVTGNTYPVKEKLKALGARWNGVDKVWMVDADKLDEAQRIVASGAVAGAQRSFSSQPSFRPSRCKECGCAGSRYNPIYRSGVCKDCYVSEKEEREMGY
jgi:hypothetical protein